MVVGGPGPRRVRLAGICGLLVVVVAGCGGPRIDAPSAQRAGATPDVVVAPDDPADDPQLAALDLGNDQGEHQPAGADAATATAEGIARLERLPALVGGLHAQLGDDVEVCSVEVSYGMTSAQVPLDGDLWEQWRLGLDDDRLFRTPQQVPLACPATFPLDGVDLAVPVRLAEGIARRLPGARLGTVRLSREPDDWGTVWRIEVSRGGESATVVADPEGAVLAVTP